MGGCNWNSELTQYSIPVKYIVYAQFMAASALIKNTVSVEEWIAPANFVK